MTRRKKSTSKPKCIECGKNTIVAETRPGDGVPIMYYRTRKCVDPGCHGEYTTWELYAPEQGIPRIYQKR